LGESWFETSKSKKFTRPHLNKQKLGTVAYTSHSRYTGSINRRIVVQAGLSKKQDPTGKNI
jgi:hypothetical protein